MWRWGSPFSPPGWRGLENIWGQNKAGSGTHSWGVSGGLGRSLWVTVKWNFKGSDLGPPSHKAT